MSRWAPAGLPKPVQDLVLAIDRQFQPLRPARPVRLPAFDEAQLTDDFAATNPYGLAVNKDTGAIVGSVLVLGVWKWRNADGSAL
jgi:hypothetical protein